MTTQATLPLRKDELGTIRISNTRVTLESVIEAFKTGASCEEIVLQFPTLELSDVYAVIGFYLKNKTAVDQYLERGTKTAEALKQKIQTKFPAQTIRERLLKRKTNQQPANG